MLPTLIRAAVFAALTIPAFAAEITSSVDAESLSKSRQTVLGLYLTPADADRALAADPSIILIDVRTRAEFQFVGHPTATDQNIPVRFLDPEMKHDGKKGYGMVENPKFADQVAALMAREGKGKDDPIFVICRSGGRSARATDKLAALGYTNVWNLVEGFEGGKDKATGQRSVNGWKNAGLPWTFTVSPGQASVD